MAPFGFQDQEDGQGMVEYALILLLIALTVLVALTALGDGLITLYEWILSEFP